jgi:hypothetical protein
VVCKTFTRIGSEQTVQEVGVAQTRALAAAREDCVDALDIVAADGKYGNGRFLSAVRECLKIYLPSNWKLRATQNEASCGGWKPATAGFVLRCPRLSVAGANDEAIYQTLSERLAGGRCGSRPL